MDTESLIAKDFNIRVKNSDENERLDHAGLLPVRIRNLGHAPVQFSLNGFKRRHFAIWRTSSETGFKSVPGKLEDVLTIRFVLSGAISRKESRSEVEVDTAYGFASLFVDMEAMQTTANVNMISCTVGAHTLIEHLRALNGDDDLALTSLLPVANASNRQIQGLKASLLQLHESVKTIGKADDLSYPLFEELIIYHFLSCWPRRHYQPPMVTSSAFAARRARDYIEAHLASPLSLAEIAAVAGVSVRTLQKSFRKEFDKTPVQFIIDCRLTKVHEILTSGISGQYVSQIAAAWGFLHPADFSRRYKAKFGFAPSATRRQSDGSFK